ncbi:MAG: 3-phosphoshikimate 1-carboxyvinyltransferase [Marinicaulis sp.]|nr:3-phosphoshikimate 1-carboxyvinyltransferase [Marinicaulis sp.]
MAVEKAQKDVSMSALTGKVTAPGDKSISHRALIFGALAEGETKIRGLLEGEDVLRTAGALRALGVEIEREKEVWRVAGGKLSAPEKPLYLGNSGTGARLIMGLLAGGGLAASLDGDLSLRSRPMGRVLEPLEMMGASAISQDGRLPVSIVPNGQLKGIEYRSPVASAQVKSAVLIAGLFASGVTTFYEPAPTRDHTERMLAAFGASIDVSDATGGGRVVTFKGGQRLSATEIIVPGDPSSAAFLAAAALIMPGSDITIENVLVNPHRTGFYNTLEDMGADVTFENERVSGGEPIADVRVRHSKLNGVNVPPERAASMIDEYPILSVVASFAKGETRFAGVGELRVKESDRLASMKTGLRACGVNVETGDDWMRVTGGAPRGGACVATHNDHRIAMSFLTMGLATKEPVTVDDTRMIATSFPDFAETIAMLGGNIRQSI